MAAPGPGRLSLRLPRSLLDPGQQQLGCGDADGLVPVQSALLRDSEPITLPGVAHGGAFGARWYGTPEVVQQWWRG